jgi:hypothetical protein
LRSSQKWSQIPKYRQGRNGTSRDLDLDSRIQEGTSGDDKGRPGTGTARLRTARQHVAATTGEYGARPALTRRWLAWGRQVEGGLEGRQRSLRALAHYPHHLGVRGPEHMGPHAGAVRRDDRWHGENHPADRLPDGIVSGLAWLVLGWLVGTRGFTSANTLPQYAFFGLTTAWITWVLISAVLMKEPSVRAAVESN